MEEKHSLRRIGKACNMETGESRKIQIGSNRGGGREIELSSQIGINGRCMHMTFLMIPPKLPPNLFPAICFDLTA
jgi:hypothetical protein